MIFDKKWLKTILTFGCIVLFTLPVFSQIDKFEYYTSNKNIEDTIVYYNPNFPLFSGLLQTGIINMQFDCSGTFGAGFSLRPINTPISESFETPALSHHEYLYGGALWIGGIVGQDTLVSVGADGWSASKEFYPPNYPLSGSVTESNSFSDYALSAFYTDTTSEGIQNDYFGRPHIPLNISVANTAHVFRNDSLNEVIFYDILITNIGIETISDMFVANYFDCDVGSRIGPHAGIFHVDDYSGSLPNGLVYTIDNDGDTEVGMYNSNSVTKAFATKLLASSQPVTDSSFNWWVSDGDANKDFGPRKKGTIEDPFRDFMTGGIGTPEGDVNKYYMMRHDEWDYDVFRTREIPEDDPIWMYPSQNLAITWNSGLDTRTLNSYGSFNLLPDSSIRLIFIVVTGDDVHSNPSNFNVNMLSSYNPDQYFANLNFLNINNSLTTAESLIEQFFDPLNPVTGIQASFTSDDSIVVKWNQWASNSESDIDGFNIYLSEIDNAALPYPGICPPWFAIDESATQISLGKQTSYTFDNLDRDKFYLFTSAHRLQSQVGELGSPIVLNQRSVDVGPQRKHEYAFYYTYEQRPIVEWLDPQLPDIDHFNVYKFDGMNEWSNRYQKFYSKENSANNLIPKDSFSVDDVIYYYYQMTPVASVPARQTNWQDDYCTDSTIYVVTYVTTSGFESQFSERMRATEISPIQQDILVLTNGRIQTFYLTTTDQKKAFYNSLLTGYSYSVLSLFETNPHIDCYPLSSCLDVLNLSKYRVVIIDDDILEDILDISSVDEFDKFIKNSGILVNFGTLKDLEFRSINDQIISKQVQTNFAKQYFGIDSIHYLWWQQYFIEGLWDDSIFAFSWAEPSINGIPSLHVDQSINYFEGLSAYLNYLPNDAPVNVATFTPNENGQVTHLFRSLNPNESIFEDNPIGIKTETPFSVTYLFGFHLYYMQPNMARNLIDYIVSDIQFIQLPETFTNYDSIYTFWANALDPMTFSIEITNLIDTEHEINDLSSIRINSTLTPTTANLNPNNTSHFGEVLELELPMREFIRSYGLLHDYVDTTFVVSGNYADGTTFEVSGDVIFRAHVYGDIDGSMSVDISDLVFMIEYFWHNGENPEPLSRADLNNDKIVDIGDVIALIDFMFR